MTPQWRDIESTMILAEAYDAELETIYLRFKGDREYYYESCPPHIWQAFTAPGQSRGEYFNAVLKHKPNGKWMG